MDDRTFDTLVRSLLGTRRSLVAGLLAVPLGWLGAPGLAARKKDKPRKPKNEPKPKPNQYGCLKIGDPCKRAGQCCSGICKGKPGKKKCRAHGKGTCRQGVPGFCQVPGEDIPLVTCNNDRACVCVRTTSGSNFCYDNGASVDICADCQDDADCEALGYPRGSACAPVSTGLCTGSCESGMACLVPCGYEPPASERSQTTPNTPLFRIPRNRAK